MSDGRLLWSLASKFFFNVLCSVDPCAVAVSSALLEFLFYETIHFCPLFDLLIQ